MLNKSKYIVLLFFTFTLNFFAQKISSVQLFNQNSTDFSSFIFEKNTQFIFSFDDLDKQPSNFYYTITHYNANWEKSNLFVSEYLKGNPTVFFNQFSNSFSTTTFYRNYQLTFPNKNTNFLVSGNFSINVFSSKNNKNPIIQRKFCLYENLNPLNLEFFRQVGDKNKNQRIEISLNSKDDFKNNLNNLKVYTIQNNNLNSIKEYKYPFFIGNRLVYNGINNVFDGGNEYYFFDTKILNINGFSTYKIEQIDNLTHTYILPNNINDNKNYVFINDLNGGFYFRTLNFLSEFDSKVSSDYTFVYFTLNSEKQLLDPIYIVGGFNNWETNENNKMVYNEINKAYQLKLFLKQGYYNYTYATNNNSSLNLSEINGSFWQTENNYKSLLYYRSFGERYDKLIGYGDLGITQERN